MRRIAAVLVLGVVAATAGGAHAAYPGGNGRIAFLSNRGGGGYKLFTMKSDGSAVQLVTKGVNPNSPPSWSADGTKLVFTTGAGSRLSTVNADGSGKTSFSFLGWWGSWSPNGKKIAFENEADGIDIAEAAGGSPGTLIADEGAGDVSKWQPSWSPNGKRVAFTSGAGEHSGAIWTINANGAGNFKLTNGDTKGEIDSAPDWSPNGKQIAFQRYVDCTGGSCKNAIYTVPAGGGPPKLVAKNAARPSWSPNGKRIVFVRRSGGSSDVWVMNADGTGQKRLTKSYASDLAPDWQPR
jgi:TolB protein